MEVMKPLVEKLSQSLNCRNCHKLPNVMCKLVTCTHCLCNECAGTLESCPECSVPFKKSQAQKDHVFRELVLYTKQLQQELGLESENGKLSDDDEEDKNPAPEKSKKSSSLNLSQSTVVSTRSSPRKKKQDAKGDTETETTPQKSNKDADAASNSVLRKSPRKSAVEKLQEPDEGSVKPKRGRPKRMKVEEDSEEVTFRKPTATLNAKRSRDDRSVASSRASSRSSSTESKRQSGSKMVLLGTSLDDEQKDVLKKFAKTFEGKVVDEFTNKVTHIVGSVIGATQTTVRTLKYMKGLVSNKTLVSIQWALDSIKEKQVQEATDYELKGTKNQAKENLGAPQRSRETREKIFEDTLVYFDGKFSGKQEAKLPNKEELVALVELGGGRVIKELPSTKRQSEMNNLLMILEDSKKTYPSLTCKQIGAKELFEYIVDFKNPLL
ncbi:Breast cancer type 1 susceptibility -like protein [Halotydeus destructor]|nr:Breast cancer type 1 susceptibility -like protein [Halotydeus destructor]